MLNLTPPSFLDLLHVLAAARSFIDILPDISALYTIKMTGSNAELIKGRTTPVMKSVVQSPRPGLSFIVSVIPSCATFEERLPETKKSVTLL